MMKFSELNLFYVLHLKTYFRATSTLKHYFTTYILKLTFWWFGVEKLLFTRVEVVLHIHNTQVYIE